jgi:osmoprotectant transport system permease protein
VFAYLARHPLYVGELALQHLGLVAAALVIALCFAVPVGIFAARHGRLAGPIVAVLNVIYTIPSLALFALLIPALGLGFWTAVAGLAAYGQMILVRNTVAALAGIDPGALEAARGVGMSEAQVLWRVQRPLGMPVFIAGLRVATVSLIGIATIAAWVNAGGLGTLVLGGIEQDYPAEALAGAVAAVALAFAADVVLRRLERKAS